MSESTPSTSGSLTPESAKQLPDRELIATHDEAETVAEREPATESSDAAEKVALAESELKRRGTTAD